MIWGNALGVLPGRGGHNKSAVRNAPYLGSALSSPILLPPLSCPGHQAGFLTFPPQLNWPSHHLPQDTRLPLQRRTLKASSIGGVIMSLKLDPWLASGWPPKIVGEKLEVTSQILSHSCSPFVCFCFARCRPFILAGACWSHLCIVHWSPGGVSVWRRPKKHAQLVK